MDSKLIFELTFINHIFLFTPIFSMNYNKFINKSWFVGRTPPSKFEYSELNGFYSPKKARQICENNFQCGGFTFKGTKRIKHIIPEVFFFHYIYEKSDYLTSNIRYPHWTTYIVKSRDYIVINGELQNNKNHIRKSQCK